MYIYLFFGDIKLIIISQKELNNYGIDRSYFYCFWVILSDCMFCELIKSNQIIYQVFCINKVVYKYPKIRIIDYLNKTIIKLRRFIGYFIKCTRFAVHTTTKDDPDIINITPINAIYIQLLWKIIISLISPKKR